jgi:hypothetical protein
MAALQSDTFLVRSEKIAKNIENSLKLCGNIKTSEKTKIVDSTAELIVIIKSMDQIIKDLKSGKSDDNNDFNAFCLQQQNVNKELFRKLDELKTCFVLEKSFTTVLSSGRQSFEDMTIKRPKNVVIVKPDDENTTAMATENVIKKTLKNKNKSIAIQNIRHISRGGLAIDCGSDEDSKKLIETLSKNIPNIRALEPKKRNPKLVVYDIPEEMTEEEIIEDIITKNKGIKTFLETQTNSRIEDHISCKFKFRRHLNNTNTQRNSQRNHQNPVISSTNSLNLSQETSSNGTNTWVLEVSPMLRKIMINLNKVFIGFKSCKVRDYLPIVRCHECHGYGHMKKDCNNKDKSVCGHCGGEHRSGDCNTSAQKCCVNCMKSNNSKNRSKNCSTNHSVFDDSCETYQRIRRIIISRINYE